MHKPEKIKDWDLLNQDKIFVILDFIAPINMPSLKEILKCSNSEEI